jgi:hypothetical protein
VRRPEEVVESEIIAARGAQHDRQSFAARVSERAVYGVDRFCNPARVRLKTAILSGRGRCPTSPALNTSTPRRLRSSAAMRKYRSVVEDLPNGSYRPVPVRGSSL